MKKSSEKILQLISAHPKGISLQKILLREKLGTKKHLKNLHKDLSFLRKQRWIRWDQQQELFIPLSQKVSSKTYFKEEFSDSRLNSRLKIKNNDIPSKDFSVICDNFNLSPFFSKQLQQEAKKILEKDLSKTLLTRKDCRQDFVITIDGEDAKDLDDAVCVVKNTAGYRLYVHIADVSFFVKENSLIDQEAKKRSNSVYLIDKVIPMLPFALSNQLCSLNPKEEKLTFCAEINLSPEGKVLSYEFYESLIESRFRLSYSKAQDILNEEKDHPAYFMLKDLADLAHILKEKRLKEGSLDFHVPEISINCDKEGVPLNFSLKTPLWTHSLIEECMLCANQVAADFLIKHKKGIFRVHLPPVEEKLEEFYLTLKSMGYHSKPLRSSHDIQKLLESFKEDEQSSFLNILLIRTMSQAIYSYENQGHFGLGFEAYTHFTSPIRRYSDLLVHRQIKNILYKTPLQNNVEALKESLKQCSSNERLAMDAERQIKKRKSIHFLKNSKNPFFDSIITNINQKGIFVQINPFGIDGFIPKKNLKPFKINEDKKIAKGKRETLSIGNKIQVKIEQLNLKKGFVDLALK